MSDPSQPNGNYGAQQPGYGQQYPTGPQQPTGPSYQAQQAPTQPYGAPAGGQQGYNQSGGYGAPQQFAAQQGGYGQPPKKKSKLGVLLGVGIPVVAILAFVGVGAVVGFGNAYETTVVEEAFTVVDQEEQPETFRTEGTGLYDVDVTDDRICGDGADYKDCIDKHQATFDENCEAGTVTDATQYVCDTYDEFIDRLETAYASCGTGCKTIADASGKWGLPYLERTELTEQVSNNDAKEYIAHTEYKERVEKCSFDFLFLQVGFCPGKDVGTDFAEMKDNTENGTGKADYGKPVDKTVDDEPADEPTEDEEEE